MFRIRVIAKGKRLLPAGLIVLAAGGAAAGALAAGHLKGEDPGPPRVPEHWQRGVNLTAFLPDAYSSGDARRAMLTARAAGTDVVALTPTWYMDAADSSGVAPDPAKTPSDASVVAAAREAQSLGLRVMIKPHVDVRDGTFRGEIAPVDRTAWFESYGEMVDRYAKLARRVHARAFVVGTELTSMSADEEQWRGLIDRVRRVYRGEVTFAANWVDGAEQIGFWDALDAIGIDAYMPLGDDREPAVSDLVTAWGPYVERMKLLHERWGLPIAFTELGYESRIGTAARIEEGTAPVSETAQADAYEAAFEALSPVAWFRGIWWWDWSAEGLGIGPGDGSFSPEGKDAALVLERWQAG